MTITIEQIKHKQAELDALIRAFEEQEEAKFPKDGDEVFYIDIFGKIQEGIYYYNLHKDMRSLANVFRTKEEAEFAVEQLKVIAEMKRCGGVFNDKPNRNARFFLKRSGKGVFVEGTINPCNYSMMWFPTTEQAQKAIDTIGEDRLLKYWFCVEE